MTPSRSPFAVERNRKRLTRATRKPTAPRPPLFPGDGGGPMAL